MRSCSRFDFCLRSSSNLRSRAARFCLSCCRFVTRLCSLQGKGSFYIAQYPVHWTAQSALQFSFSARPVHSDTNSASLGSILAMQAAAIKHKDYSLTFLQSAVYSHVYSIIQLSELGCQWREQKCPNFKTVAKGMRMWAFLITSPTFYC